MSILDLNNEVMKPDEGLNTYTGSGFSVLIAKAKEQKDKINFSDEANKTGKYLIYPTNQGINVTVNQITADYVGSPTTEIYQGSSTYAGELGVGGFPNSNNFYTSMVFGGYNQKEVKGAIISITGPDMFAVWFNEAEKKIVLIEGEDTFTKNEITYTETMKISELITEINKVNNFSARLLIGTGDELVSLDNMKAEKLNTELVFGYRRVAFIELGDMTSETKAKYPMYINIMKPEEGDPTYFNLLVYHKKNALKPVQYTGCQFKSMNITFANNALTTISGSVWVDKAETLTTNAFYYEREEKRDAVMAQTSVAPTKVYVNGLEAKSISDINIAFEWTKDEIFNIAMDRYNVPNGKYTFTIGGNAMFNKQSDDLFFNRLLEGFRLSAVIESNMKYKGKNYLFVVVSTNVSGQPSKPAISATGNLQVALNGFQALESSEDKNSSYIISFTDRAELF